MGPMARTAFPPPPSPSSSIFGPNPTQSLQLPASQAALAGGQSLGVFAHHFSTIFVHVI